MKFVWGEQVVKLDEDECGSESYLFHLTGCVISGQLLNISAKWGQPFLSQDLCEAKCSDVNKSLVMKSNVHVC